MISLKFIFLVLIITPLVFSLHPAIYGTKRYGRSIRSPPTNWNLHHQPQQQQQQQQKQQQPNHPFYQAYPNNEDYYYYMYHPQYQQYHRSYHPAYYPPPRTSKYEVYQAVLPFYDDLPVTSNTNGVNPGYYFDENDDLRLQEAEREEREEAQPIGREQLYEEDPEDFDQNLDDVNAAFLQNLIISQVYNKQQLLPRNYYLPHYDQAWERLPQNKEDKDVRELKQLAESDEEMHWFGHSQPNKRTKWSKTTLVPFTTEKIPSVALTSTPRPQIVSGQKEEVLNRPATAVRNVVITPVLDTISKSGNNERKRSPSVYETIRRMLEMEKKLEKENKVQGMNLRPSMKKRIITSEQTLAQQLSVLKNQQQQ